MKKIISTSLLVCFCINAITAQDKEVIKTAKQFCHATSNFFYFKNDETLKTKFEINLSEIFDYEEGTYFVTGGKKTILIIPIGTIEKNLEKAYNYFGEEGIYTFAAKGQSKTVMKDDKAIYRFYPYKNTIVFEQF